MLRAMTNTGRFVWYELLTTDPNSAIAFYSEVVGWKTEPFGDAGDYTQLGGMMTTPKDMKTPDGRQVPPSWMYYVTTGDLDAALARAKTKGVRVLNGPMEVPGGQRIVQLMDPQGAAFALVTPPKS
jgi:predicted enzyme related to lactoylglutathione lyase